MWLSGLRTQQSVCESVNLIPGLTHSIATSCSVGCRCGLDLAFLWLWCSPQLYPNLPPSLGTCICHRCGPEKKKKEHFFNVCVCTHLDTHTHTPPPPPHTHTPSTMQPSYILRPETFRFRLTPYGKGAPPSS